MISLTSSTPATLQEILSVFGNRPFMFHHAQRRPRYAIINAYEAEDAEFKKHFKPVLLSNIPTDANIISRHTTYKIKMDGNNQLCFKARSDPHRNDHSIKDQLRTDCFMCSLTGIRLILTIVSIMHWKVTRADAKAAFLNTDRAEHDVFVKPPRKSHDKKHCWLLLVSVYGLVNSNAKWQHQCDEVIFNTCLKDLSVITQLFYKMKNGELVIIATKIVNDLLMSGEK